MSTLQTPILQLARVVLQARTPLSISSGSPDGVFDTELIRDANNLPAIPATSLAGVLRSLWRAEYGEPAEREVFGFQRGSAGAASRLHIGWGHLLDSNGRAVVGLALGDAEKRLHQDPLLRAALEQIDAPQHRDRVRLTHKGAAADTGKFDRTVLPAGYRFAVELRLWDAADSAGEDWQRLLRLLAHPGLRLGGGTRAGLGAVEVVSAHGVRLDLRDPTAAQTLARLGADPSELTGLQPLPIPQMQSQAWLHAELTLQARGLWRIGKGSIELERARGRAPSADKDPDEVPVIERRVLWQGGRGRVDGDYELLLPAASLKGVLAHRMAFHANRFAGRWADDRTDPTAEPETPPEVRALLGEVKHSGSDSGLAGALFIDDAWLPLRDLGVQRLPHNGIDRFTGGVREHILFEEQNVYGGKARVRLAIDPARLSGNCARLGVSADAVQKAFLAALDDLGNGRLALGARSTSGNGFFTAEIPAPLKAAWPQPQAPATPSPTASETFA